MSNRPDDAATAQPAPHGTIDQFLDYRDFLTQQEKKNKALISTDQQTYATPSDGRQNQNRRVGFVPGMPNNRLRR